jgi:histidyl-tRNA synthetase
VPDPDAGVFVVAIGEDAHVQARSLVRALRREGVIAETAYEERPLKAQLKMADRAGAAYAAIVGDCELEAGTVTLRRLEDGQQDDVTADAVVGRLVGETEAG